MEWILLESGLHATSQTMHALGCRAFAHEFANKIKVPDRARGYVLTSNKTIVVSVHLGRGDGDSGACSLENIF